MGRCFWLLPALIALGGCAAQPTIGSVKGGECKLAHTPVYAVKGRTAFDQEWIDDTTEALVRGCKQPRPKARPASLDAVKPVPQIERHDIAPVAPPPATRHWWQWRW